MLTRVLVPLLAACWLLPSHAGAAAPPPQQPAPPQPKADGFGPMIELAVPDDGPDRPFLVDFDTGRLIDLPREQMDHGMKAAFRWMAAQGVDAMGEGEDDGMLGLDLIARRIEGPIADRFPDIPDALANRLLGQLAEVGDPGTPMNLDAKAGVGPAATYLFRTREGSAGVLQIVGWDPDDQAVHVCYRLRRGEAGGKAAAEAGAKTGDGTLPTPAADGTARRRAGGGGAAPRPADPPPPPDAPPARLGAPVEQVLQFLDAAGAESPVFDLETRQLVRTRQAWAGEPIWNARQTPILAAKSRPTGQMKVEHAAVVRVPDALWDAAPDAIASKLRRLAPARPSEWAVLPYAEDLPVTYLWKSRYGALGVLQIVEIAEPDGVRFRYRVLEDGPAEPHAR